MKKSTREKGKEIEVEPEEPEREIEWLYEEFTMDAHGEDTEDLLELMDNFLAETEQ